MAFTPDSAINHPNDPSYYLPVYPMIYVTAPIIEQVQASSTCSYDHDNSQNTPEQSFTAPTRVGNYNIGTDVLSANDPSPGNELWILLPNGQSKKLFPLAAHTSIIDTSPSPLTYGSVVEPNISEDGKTVYFSYFHDANLEVNCNEGGYCLSRKGADLYSIKLEPLLNNFNLDPATLAAQRLTTRQNDSSGYQQIANRDKKAMNQVLSATTGPNQWGNVHMHPIEIRTVEGLKLLYVSDEKRMRSSNRKASIGDAAHNFNLMIADLNSDGTISNSQQFQYYTTTSALSPSPLRNGFAFSYQASTEDPRNWQIQGLDSVGKWYPIIGYGSNPELIHLSSFCVKTKGPAPGDYLVADRYYNQNNEGFGSLWAVDLSKAGQNTYGANYLYYAASPAQVGSYPLTSNAISTDIPSKYIVAAGAYRGKFTTPRCGKADEIFFGYSPTTSNGKHTQYNPLTSECQRNVYRSFIGFRPNLNAFDPIESVNVSSESGIRIVVRDSSRQNNLIWPTPVISWQERTSDEQQQFSETARNPSNNISAGMPYAEVGTSALDNTDRLPFDCSTGYSFQQGTVPFSPNATLAGLESDRDELINNTDGLTYVNNRNNFCESIINKDLVLGVSINITSNKPSLSSDYSPGFNTDGEGQTGYKKEASKLLGIYSIQGQTDTSFKAIIPANIPFDLQLISKRYGMKLTDVRSWHALKPGESRTDCGGCHNHKPGAGIQFSGTHADTHSALNLVSGTPYVEYDSTCTPFMAQSSDPTITLPEWRVDIYPKFDQYCGSCHNSNTPTPHAQAIQAQKALKYTDEISARGELIGKRFAASFLGAMGSPAWWAARNERTDGRDNNLTKYKPYWDGGPNNGYPQNPSNPNDYYGLLNYGFRHTSHPNLCDGSNLDAARWVRKFGQWIDYHMPRDNPGALGLKFKDDHYHPTVDGALSDSTSCAPEELKVGFWDDSGLIKRIEIQVNTVSVLTQNNLTNNPGFILFPISGLNSSDVLNIIAMDNANNRQMYQKTIDQFVIDCQVALNVIDETPDLSPSPSPSPSETPNPSPSPTPGDSDLSLTIENPEVSSGEMLTLSIISNNNGQFVLITTPSLNSTKLKGTIKKGNQKIKLRIPRNSSLQNEIYNFQLKFIGSNGSLYSNSVTLNLGPNNPNSDIAHKLDMQLKSLSSALKATKNLMILKTGNDRIKLKNKITKLKNKLLPFKWGKVVFGA